MVVIPIIFTYVFLYKHPVSNFSTYLYTLILSVFQQSLTLVFVETKKGADALEHWLCMNGFPATAIHGDRTQQVFMISLV